MSTRRSAPGSASRSIASSTQASATEPTPRSAPGRTPRSAQEPARRPATSTGRSPTDSPLSARIASVHPVVAPHRYAQAELTEGFAAMCGLDNGGRQVLERLHRNAMVETRHLALPLQDYRELDGFGSANNAYIEAATELGAEAMAGALERAGVRPDEVDLLVLTSVTGVAVPSIDARLISRLGLRNDVKRLPLFGLGCVGGAAGLARVADYLRAWPEHTAVLLAVELCSLTVQRADPSAANLVASALFGDGAAAVVMTGDGAGSGPEVVATRSRFYPETSRAMGWDIADSGFGVVLGPEVPEIVRRHLGADVKEFLAPYDLGIDDIGTWICHPGGPKVLEAVAEALFLPDQALDVTWRSLARVGNLSSASVLHVLHDTLETRPPAPGSHGILLAMGPGFCAELVLLRW